MSESRNIGESRGYSNYSSKSFSDKNLNSENVLEYNDIESIDTLIEKLEENPIKTTSSSPAIIKAIEKRQIMIDQLKQLRKQAEASEQEQKELEEIENANEELESAIQKVKKIIEKPTSYSLGYQTDGESRR